MRRPPGWLHKESFPPVRRFTLIAALAGLVLMLGTRRAESQFATNIDAAFLEGFAKLKESGGFIEDQSKTAATDWKPNLQLLVGVKAIAGSKRTVHFVELTTLPPPATNALGQPWQPSLRTNNWAWSPTNRVRFIYTNYPVRVRVFDETGRQLKEGRVPMAWGMLTNGLMDLCRLSLEAQRQTNSSAIESESPGDERLMIATGGGFLWMMGMFGDLQRVSTVADVWEQAQCAFRMPGLWTVAKSVFTGFSLNLAPRTDQVSLISNLASGPAAPCYCLPVDLRSEQRLLGRVEIILGPPHGAEMLLSGIRTIRARHPTKPKQEFLTQVLAAGVVPVGK